jgi:hypothetical protein
MEMKRFLFLCGMLAICLMATATEMKGAIFDNDVGIVQTDYNYTEEISATVVNLVNPATVLPYEYRLVNNQDLAIAGQPTTIEAAPFQDFNRDYKPYQTVATRVNFYDSNAPPKFASMTIYGNDTNAPTNF